MYKRIGRKSPIKPFKTRKSLKYSKRTKYAKGKPKSMSNKISNKHYAQITETVELDDIDSNTKYNEVFNLGQFTRALRLSENFKFYRAKKVLYKYEPVYNLFSENGGAGETIPLAYMIMNRTQENNTGWGKAQFEEQGALPRKFTTEINLEYTPNWCAPGLIAQKKDASGNVVDVIQQGVQKCYNWLMTPTDSLSQYRQSQFIETSGMNTLGYKVAENPAAQVIYNGHNVFFDQITEGSVRKVCRRTVTVVWEFKGPKTRNLAVQVPELKL